MKVLIAPDKFKGSLTAIDVVDHLGRGLADRGIEYVGLPLADGGDGSVSAAIQAGFQPVGVTVAGPTGQPHPALIAVDGGTAVIEVANTCGLAALPAGTLNPLGSSTRGVGQAIRSALDLGTTRLVLALGGSASTDGGAGALAALGVSFRDGDGNAIEPAGGSLGDIAAVDPSALVDLSRIEIVIATDVRNPLTGPAGAAAVYGPQKGATPEHVRDLDAGLANLVRRLQEAGFDDADQLARTPGAGSAGGLGFTGLLLGGRVVSGADFFLDLLDFASHVQGCDLVITGEGRLDGQTLEGKLPAMIARRSAPIPVIAVVGRSDVVTADLAAMGIAAVYAICELTDRNPATDPALSAQLLHQLGRTIPLPGVAG